MTEFIPFHLFILLAALGSCLLVLAILGIIHLFKQRWNGMRLRLIFDLKIYPKDPVDVQQG